MICTLTYLFIIFPNPHLLHIDPVHIIGCVKILLNTILIPDIIDVNNLGRERERERAFVSRLADSE